MDGGHGRSRVTGGAWRPRHTAGFTQVAPSGHTNEWHSRRVQRHREVPLASKGVLQFLWRKYSTAGYPALEAGPIGIAVWGMGRREICEHGGNFRLKRRKSWLQGRKSQPTGRNSFGGRWNLWAYLPRLVPPFADSPLGPFVVEEDLLEHCWRSHFFHASRERGAQWEQGLSLQHPLGRNLLHSGWGSSSDKNEWQVPHFFCFLLAWGEGVSTLDIPKKWDRYIHSKCNNTWKN